MIDYVGYKYSGLQYKIVVPIIIIDIVFIVFTFTVGLLIVLAYLIVIINLLLFPLLFLLRKYTVTQLVVSDEGIGVILHSNLLVKYKWRDFSTVSTRHSLFLGYLISFSTRNEKKLEFKKNERSIKEITSRCTNKIFLQKVNNDI